jgi:DnaJ-class molecular chaperone
MTDTLPMTTELAEFYNRAKINYAFPVKLTVTCMKCDQVKWQILEELTSCFVCGGKPVTFEEKGIVGGAN